LYHKGLLLRKPTVAKTLRALEVGKLCWSYPTLETLGDGRCIDESLGGIQGERDHVAVSRC
jgi:hypothetical protein